MLEDRVPHHVDGQLPGGDDPVEECRQRGRAVAGVAGRRDLSSVIDFPLMVIWAQAVERIPEVIASETMRVVVGFRHDPPLVIPPADVDGIGQNGGQTRSA